MNITIRCALLALRECISGVSYPDSYRVLSNDLLLAILLELSHYADNSRLCRFGDFLEIYLNEFGNQL